MWLPAILDIPYLTGKPTKKRFSSPPPFQVWKRLQPRARWRPATRPRFGGIKDQRGRYISQDSAEYAQPLADAIAIHIAPHLSEGDDITLHLRDKPIDLTLAKKLGDRRVASLKKPADPTCNTDGGGLPSSGDWSSIPPQYADLGDPLQSIRVTLLRVIHDNDLHKQLVANIAVNPGFSLARRTRTTSA